MKKCRPTQTAVHTMVQMKCDQKRSYAVGPHRMSA